MDDNNYEEGMEPETSGEFEQDPTLAKYQTAKEQDRWIKEFEAARKFRARVDKRGVDTVEKFASRRWEKDEDSKLNLFTANTEIIMSALCAQLPAPDVVPANEDPDDDVARVGSVIYERNINYELREENFLPKLKQMIQDMCVAGMGIGWVRYEQEEQDPQYQTIQQPIIDPTTGQQATDPMTGQPRMQFVRQEIAGSNIKKQCSPIDFVSWNDFFYAPCTVAQQCRWVARRIPMTKEAVSDQFPNTAETVLDEISYGNTDSDTNTSRSGLDKLKPKYLIQKTADIYEVWDKEHGVIFWINEDASLPLDVKADTMSLPEFFPTPMPPMGRFENSELLMISDYSLAQDLYNDVDRLQTRLARLTDSLRVNFLYDQGNPALAKIFQDGGELKGIPVDNWKDFMNDKGGVAGSMSFIPLDDNANSYTLLSGILDKKVSQINNIIGITELMQGMSSQYENVGQTQLRNAQGSGRISVKQRNVAEYVQALLRLKAHFMKMYQPRILVARAGKLSDADQQFIQPAVQMIQNPDVACYEVNVSVDSIQLPNWNLVQKERTEVIGMLTNMFAQIPAAAEKMPSLAVTAMQFAKWSVASMKGSATIIGDLEKGIAMAEQQMQQQASQPPKPSPADMEATAGKAKLQVQRKRPGMPS